MLDSNQIPQLQYALVLLHTFSSGSQVARTLWSTFADLNAALYPNPTHLAQYGVTIEKINALKNPPWALIDREIEWATHDHQHLIPFATTEYPQLLQEISGAPLLLFLQGNKNILNHQQLAIVGSRNPSPTGCENAHAFAQQLTTVGLTITSGFASGIDAAAHQGCLAAQGTTIAVMGAGLDHIYPQKHKYLATEIVDHGGALISEFPLQVAPMADNFPQRNRIISGLSLGTLVVEATLRSGSLITARLAAEQGREVFAIPSSIHSPLATGCHALIRQGAKLVENIQDILEEFAHLENNLPSNPKSLAPKGTSFDPINEIKLETNYKKLLACVGYEATPIDVLTTRSNLTIPEITSILLFLEVNGYVRRASGGYVRCAVVTASST